MKAKIRAWYDSNKLTICIGWFLSSAILIVSATFCSSNSIAYNYRMITGTVFLMLWMIVVAGYNTYEKFMVRSVVGLLEIVLLLAVNKFSLNDYNSSNVFGNARFTVAIIVDVFILSQWGVIAFKIIASFLESFYKLSSNEKVSKTLSFIVTILAALVSVLTIYQVLSK